MDSTKSFEEKEDRINRYIKILFAASILFLLMGLLNFGREKYVEAITFLLGAFMFQISIVKHKIENRGMERMIQVILVVLLIVVIYLVFFF
ncbi:hypothetical protein K8I28_14260 [bacterium]|nr:hypothetical protein [bacterium]